MFYIVYETTNTINNKKYIGIHQTKDLEDDYLGSGKLLLKAIKKYGKSSFIRKIIFVCSSIEQAASKEIELVNENWCARKDTYNMMPGGKWGSKERNGLSFKGKKHSEKTKKSISKKLSGFKHTEKTKQLMSKNNFSKRNPIEQKRHASKAAKSKKTEEWKLNISKALLQRNAKVQSHNKGKVREKIECPHCKKVGAKNVMVRFHYDNCKYIGSKSIGTDNAL